MRQGAGIHMRDRNNDTPLLCAIKAGHRDVVRSLVSCGAHLQKGSLELGKDQCISWMPNKCKKTLNFETAKFFEFSAKLTF